MCVRVILAKLMGVYSQQAVIDQFGSLKLLICNYMFKYQVRIILMVSVTNDAKQVFYSILKNNSKVVLAKKYVYGALFEQ